MNIPPVYLCSSFLSYVCSSVVTFSNSRTHHVRLELTCCVDSRTNRTSSVDFAFHLVYSADTTVISDVVSVSSSCVGCVGCVGLWRSLPQVRSRISMCLRIALETSLEHRRRREYQSNVVGDFSRTPEREYDVQSKILHFLATSR